MVLKFSTGGKGEIGDTATGWSVNEYATPTVVGQSSDGTNNASYAGVSKPASIFLVDKQGVITHTSDQPGVTSLGSMIGDIQSVAPGPANVAISQNSLMTKLSVDRTASAVSGGAQIGSPWSASSRNGDYSPYAITGTAINREGTRVYVLSRLNSGTQQYLTAFDNSSGVKLWRITINSTAIFVGNPITVNRLGRIVVRTGLNSVGLYASADGKLIRTGQYRQVNWANTAEQYRDETTYLSIDNEPSDYLGGMAASRVDSGSSLSGVNIYTLQKMRLDEFGDGYYDATQYSTTGLFSPSRTTVSARAILWLTGERFLAYGPILPNDPADQGWAIYQPVQPWPSNSFDRAPTRVRFVSSPYSVDNGVTTQDSGGAFLIGDRQYNADGIEIQNLEGARRRFMEKMPPGATWKVIGVSDGGAAIFMSMPNFVDPTGPLATLQFDTVSTKTTLSEAIQYYIGLVFGVNRYSIDYVASQNPLVVLPGWKGNVLEYLIQLFVVYKLEMTLVDNRFLIRDIGSREIDIADIEGVITPRVTVVGNSREVAVSYTRAKIASGTARPAMTLVNLSTNPRAGVNTVDYVGKSDGQNATVRRSASAVESGSFSLDGDSTTNNTYIVYGSTLVDGVRIGTKKRMGLTQGQTYVVTVRMVILRLFNDATSHPNVRQFAVKLNKANGEERWFWSKKAPNVYGSPIDTSVEFYFDPDYDDAAIIFMQGTTLYSASDPKGVTAFGPVRITPKGLATEEFPDTLLIWGGQKGWQWTGAAENSTSVLSVPASPADNLLYDARADGNKTFSVAARAQEVTVLTLNVWPSYIQQPVATSDLNAPYGTYYVSGSDNLPVQAAQWIDYGGRVDVSIGEEPNQIVVTMTGPLRDIPGVPGPYKLSASDGKTDYSFFSLIGAGVVTDPQELTLPTGVDAAKVTRESSGIVDNFAVRTLEDAYRVGYALSDSQGAASIELSFTVPISKIEKFGVTPGSLFTYGGARYRVVGCVISNGSASITARKFTRVDDVVSYYGDITVDQMALAWSGYTAHDATVMPMKGLTQ